MDIIDTINKSDSKVNIDLFVKLLNGLVNFTKYIEKTFTPEMSRENNLFTFLKQYKNGNILSQI